MLGLAENQSLQPTAFGRAAPLQLQAPGEESPQRQTRGPALAVRVRAPQLELVPQPELPLGPALELAPRLELELELERAA